VDTWTFIFLMVALKIPIILLFGLVYWAVRAVPDSAADDSDDGGSKRPLRPHPRGPLPRPARRGPHGDRRSPAPPRTRSVLARSRDNHHA
jgi:hypothetical protein